MLHFPKLMGKKYPCEDILSTVQHHIFSLQSQKPVSKLCLLFYVLLLLPHCKANNKMKKLLDSNRREFLKTSSKAGIAAGLSLTVLPSLVKANTSFSYDDYDIPATPYAQQP